MKRYRWSMAAVSIFGGLALMALALFGLLVSGGWMEARSEGATIYWMVSVIAIVLFGAWLLVVLWCYLDAESREMNAALWALLVFLLSFPIGPLLYLVLRQPPRQSPPAEQRSVPPRLDPPPP